MPEFAVLVRTSATPDFSDLDLLDALVEAFAPTHGAISQEEGRLTTQITVTAEDKGDAVRVSEQFVLEALASVGIVLGDDGVESVEVTTQAVFERWLDTPPDLLTTGEVAELLKLSPQRIRQLALEHPEFPAPRKVGRELTFPGPAVRRFATLDRIPGRHTDPKGA